MASKVPTDRNRPPDYYAVLGVAPTATFREIEDAYWRLAKSESERDRIALLNEAYEVLGHTERREAYDATYEPAPEDEAEEESDGFEERWGGRGRRGKLRFYFQ